MSAYLIADVDVTDPVAYETYKTLAAEAIASHGGRYLVRGAAVSVLEGDWEPSRIVVVEFPDAETARRMYDSEEYREAREARRDAARMRMILVEGLAT